MGGSPKIGRHKRGAEIGFDLFKNLAHSPFGTALGNELNGWHGGPPVWRMGLAIASTRTF
jgi:hypothetical protein